MHTGHRARETLPQSSSNKQKYIINKTAGIGGYGGYNERINQESSLLQLFDNSNNDRFPRRLPATAAGCFSELKPVIDKYVEVWNSGNLGELDAIFDPNFVRRVNQIPDVHGIDGLKKVISGFRTAYPDLKLVIEDWIYSENKSSGRWIFTGTNTGPGEMSPTGKPVKVWGISTVHVTNGKITEEWVAYDNQSFMEQLGGTMTPPSGAKK